MLGRSRRLEGILGRERGKDALFLRLVCVRHTFGHWVQASPLDAACETEGKVVCHQGHIKGQPGVAMDDLVYIMTKMARNMEAQGLDKMFDAAEAATAAIEEARPLIHRVTDLVEEVHFHAPYFPPQIYCSTGWD